MPGVERTNIIPSFFDGVLPTEWVFQVSNNLSSWEPMDMVDRRMTMDKVERPFFDGIADEGLRMAGSNGFESRKRTDDIPDAS